MIDLSISLNNVTIELLYSHPNGDSVRGESLARLDFITSTLSFVGYSNESKDIDLVSHRIKVSDTRECALPTFTDILQVRATVIAIYIYM